MSGCRKQIKLVINAPYNATLIKILLGINLFGKIDTIRSRPYPPNFRRIAAKTIDPAIGASTWAFGSHRCTMNMGNLTINPAIRKNQKIDIFS
jgi:hypothetical protein